MSETLDLTIRCSRCNGMMIYKRANDHDITVYCCHCVVRNQLSEAQATIARLESERMEDSKRLDWMDANIDDVTVMRDIGKGNRFEITYCASESGCQIETSNKNLRAAIDAAGKAKQ